MENTVERNRLINLLRDDIQDERVLDVMLRIPRDEFVPPPYTVYAWEDRALPIGHQQTISQPTIVAMMTEALELSGTEKVLEIGTGSGYQTAILAELAGYVESVERLPELLDQARQILDTFDYNNISLHRAGTALGWPKEAPYDAIIVTAGAPSVPLILLSQLKMDGILVIPVGSREEQHLLKIIRREKENEITDLGGCRFVPLIGTEAWDDRSD